MLKGFKILASIALFVLVIYAIILFGEPYYYFHVFKSDLEETLSISMKYKNEDLLDKIMQFASESNIPIEKEDVEILSEGKRKAIYISWSETVDFFGVYQKTYDFQIDISQ